VLATLAEDLRVRGDLDLSQCTVSGMFVVAKKGAQKWERPSGARVRSSWQWQTALVFLSPSTLEIPAAPGQTRLAANQPKVQNLTTNVHESGQILDFEPSLKQPAEPAVRGPENKVSPKNDPAAETATPAEKPKPIYVPVKSEEVLPRPELVPVRERGRYSRTRTR
jgi:hypothetical protein